MAEPLPWQMKDIDDRKREFAALIYERPDNDGERMKAARQLFPGQHFVGFCGQIAQEWHLDPIVEAELIALREREIQNLPSAARVSRDVYNLASDTKLTVDERLKAYRLYGELNGMLQKAAIINNNTNNHTNLVDNRRVMVVPAPMPDDEFERKAMAMQARLIADDD